MKTSDSNSKRTKAISFLFIFLSLTKFSFSQNSLVRISKFNFEIIIPVVFVAIVGLFLVSLFIKQKNH